MPKKTREEKIAAQLRRLKKQLEGGQVVAKPTPVEPKVAEEPTGSPVITPTGVSLKELGVKTTPSTTVVKKELERYDYAYVARDLRKIAILAVAAVAIEIILNLTTRAGFAKLILRSFGLEI
jgi:hypothetical protein